MGIKMILQRIQNGFNNFIFNIQNSNERRKQMLVIGLAILFCIAAAASGLIFSSSFTPIFVGLGLCALLLVAVGLRRPWYVLYAAIFLIFIPDGLLPSNIQSYLNRGMTVFVFAVWAFDLFVSKKKVYLPLPSVFMVAFLAWAIISMTWAQDFSESLTILQSYILRFLLFLFLTVNLIDTRKKLNGLMNTLASIGFLLALTGIAEVFVSGYTPGTRFKVLGMNENAVGILLLISLLGVLWWASQPSAKFSTLKKLIGVLYIIFAILLIVMTGSRGSAISMIATLCLLLFWKSTRLWGLVALVIVLLGIVAAPSLFFTIIDRFSSAGYSGDTTLGGREALWQAAWLMIQDHPLQGVGIGNAYLQMRNYFSDSSIQTYLMPLQVWNSESVPPHNPVLTIWADVGAIGLTLYLGILVTAIYSFIRSYWRNRHTSLQMYYGLMIAVFIGYFLSWIKGGGMESDHSFFMMIAFFVIPSILEKNHEVDDTDKAIG